MHDIDPTTWTLTKEQLATGLANLKKLTVLNSTVYETDDMLKIIVLCLAVKGHNSPTSIKIRYMNSYASETEYVGIDRRTIQFGAKRIKPSYWRSWTKEPLEIAIVRPKTIKVGALQWLAQCADQDYMTLPDEILDHVLRMIIRDTYYSDYGDIEAYIKAVKRVMREHGVSLRMNNKAKDRDHYTLSRYHSQIASKENAIAKCEAEIERLEYRLGWEQERLPELKEELKSLKKDLLSKQAQIDKKRKKKASKA